MAGLFDLIKSSFAGQKQSTANLAKERLQIIIARENSAGHVGHKDFLPQLEKELIAVIRKYIQINDKDMKVSLKKQGGLEVLDVNIVIDGDNKPQIRRQPAH